MLRIASVFILAAIAICRAAPVDQLIPWLLNEDRQLRGIAFSEVILAAAAGKHVLAIDLKNETDQRVIKKISGGLDEAMKRMNTPENAIQNIGRITSKRVFYLDPKLCAAGSRDSSFRTFYFEPKIATNKVRDDAVHFIVGFEHQPSLRSGSAGEPREKTGHWKFTRWDLVDLAQFKVRLKAEFQGSNHDMYRPEAIVATSGK